MKLEARRDSIQQVLADARKLDPLEQEALVTLLLDSLPADPGAEEAWDIEIARRAGLPDDEDEHWETIRDGVLASPRSGTASTRSHEREQTAPSSRG